MTRKRAADFDQGLLNLLDRYVHGMISAGWPEYEAALQANGVTYTEYIDDGVNHGFHSESTPRYDEAAATLAWQRTIDFFNERLR